MIKLKTLILMLTIIVPSLLAQDTLQTGRTEWENGILFFKSDDGAHSTRFDVRGLINGGYFFEKENLLSDGTHIRKARFALKTQINRYWRTEWDIDVAEGAVEIKDMFVAWYGLPNSHLKIGHFKMPLGLEELMTSRTQTFVERAYPMLAFETDRRMGLQYSLWAERWNLRAALFGQSMDAAAKNKKTDETGNGFGLRLTGLPVKTKDILLHSGLAVIGQKPDDGSQLMEFQSEPETKLGDPEILQVIVPDVKYSLKTGLEGALSYKNYHLQAEYIHTSVIRLNGQKNVSLDGGYVFASWFLTGERRTWFNEEGEFYQIMPFDEKTGAWELAFRYSHLNLTDFDAGILGGKANNFTAGLNWYAASNIRFFLNFTHVDNSVFATGDDFPGDYDFNYLQYLVMFFF